MLIREKEGAKKIIDSLGSANEIFQKKKIEEIKYIRHIYIL
jgi:hypothetical protein